jgi:hypothetical protein
MGREPEDVDTDDRVARALQRVAESQQPFNQILMNQMQAIERRLNTMGDDVSETKENVAVLVNQELLQKFETLSVRITALESAENIRKGLLLATTLMPKLIMVLVILVGAVLAYLKLPNAPPLIH